MPFYLEMSKNITKQRDIYDTVSLLSYIYIYIDIYICIYIYIYMYIYLDISLSSLSCSFSFVSELFCLKFLRFS